MSAYAAPIPPLADAAPRAARVGGHDRFGNPQDTLVGEVLTPPIHTARTQHSTPAAPTAPRVVGAEPARRSVVLAMLLAAFLGPIGLVYSSRIGALVMSLFFMAITLPIVPFWPEWIFVAAIPTFFFSMLWALGATLTHNTALAVHRRLIRLAQ